MTNSVPAALIELGFSSKARTGRFSKKAALILIAILLFFLCAGTSSIRAAEGIPTIYGYEVFVPPGLSHPWGVISGPRDIIELEGSLDANDTLAADNTYVEFWQITFLYDSRVDISLNSNQIDPFLGLIRVDSTQRFIDLFEDDDSGPGLNARITADVQAGTYWIGISTFDSFETGAWSLVMESSTNSRDSSLPMVPTLYGVSVQENPNPYILGELESSDFVFDGRYVDIYQFEASEDVALQIDLTSVWFDTRLMLADVLPDGSLGTLFLLDEDGGESTNSRISRTFGPGTYFLVATSGAAGAVGEYEVSVSAAASSDQAPDDAGSNVYEAGDALPGVPASGSFVPAAVSGGSVSSNAGGTTIALDEGGYFDLSDGTRYACTSADGCAVEDGTVTRGRLEASAPGGNGVDTFPTFRTATPPGNQMYTVGAAIGALTLPEASGGDGNLTYSLAPDVPGLNFNATVRQLTGTPSEAGTYQITYTVRDADGDTDTLGFMISVSGDSGDPTMTDGFDLYVIPGDRNASPAGIAYAEGRFYLVDPLFDKVYAYTEAGQRDAAADFDLDDDNAIPLGIAYAEGRFYIVDNSRNKVYAYTEAGQRDAAADFDLDEDNGFPQGITFANGRFYVVDRTDNKVYAYTEAGQRDASADFDLDEANGSPEGITYADGRFYVVDTAYESTADEKVYAYTEAGQRLAASDFDLDEGNLSPAGIAYAKGRLYVVEAFDNKVYAYTEAGRRDAAAEFDLGDGNASPLGIAYANGRFHVVDVGDGRVYAYTEAGRRDAAADFVIALENDNIAPRGIAYAEGRFYVVDTLADKVYAYTEAGQRDAAADFDLDDDNSTPVGITYAEGRFYVVDFADGKVYAYTEAGQRDAAADFDLDDGNAYPRGIAYAEGRFYVVDLDDDRVYAYTEAGQRDAAADFDLDDGNADPLFITYAKGRLHVVDATAYRVFSYALP